LLNAGTLWEPNSYKAHYDMLVIHPRTHYIGNDPDWGFHLGPKQYELHLDGSKYMNCVFQVFESHELKSYPYWDLIPITNLMLGKRNHIIYYLAKGKYEIYVTDVKRKIIYRKTVIL